MTNIDTLFLQEFPGEADTWDKTILYFKVFDKSGRLYFLSPTSSPLLCL